MNITAADISGAARRIVINNGTDIAIRYNNLHNLRSDGIDVVGQHVLVEGNTIRDMRPQPGDHPDGIQLWSANGQQTRDIIVRNNIVTGDMQGIFARSTDLRLSSLMVTGNNVTVAYANGIVLLNTDNSTAIGNIVRPRNGSAYRVNMRVEGNNNRTCGITVSDFRDTPPTHTC